MFGNFGVAILADHRVVKLIFFPLANKSYVSMANMKKVQPKLRSSRPSTATTRWRTAAGHDGALQEREDQSGGRLLAGAVPDPGVLRALQGAVRHHRNAPRAVLRLDPGPFGADPTSLFNLFGLLPYDVPLFLLIGPCLAALADHGHHHVRPDADEPDASGPDPGDDLHLDAGGLHLHAGHLPGRSGDLLGVEQHLSVLQQGVIMKRQGAKIELWDNLKAMFKPKNKTT
jgi:YidC/Oxa1 family membrane protein insertase